MVNTKLRYQKGLVIEHLFPKKDGECACGCGNKIQSKRKKWYSNICQKKSLFIFYIIKGDTKVIRKILFERDNGFCRHCGVFDEYWQADHILAVSKGGGGCNLDNFQTLCLDCHREKTSNRIPNSNNIHTASLNFVNPFFSRLRAFDKTVSKNVE